MSACAKSRTARDERLREEQNSGATSACPKRQVAACQHCFRWSMD
jgi:hypothetical protein